MAVKGKGKQIAGKSPASSPSTSSGKRKNSVSGAQDSRDRSKRKRSGVLQFFDDAAQDADSDEEEVEKEDDDDLDFDEEDLDLDFSKGGRSEGKENKGAGKSHYFPFFVKEEELSGDELEELIKDRYGRGSEYVVYDEDPKECDDGVSIEHSAEDPNIWRVKCMVGREQQLVLCLMHKYADLQRLGTKMEIISAFTLEHVKGYVYIEADKAFDVVEACKGFFNIYSARMGLVPRNEIPHLLSIRNKACTVSKGTWVRMKNGKYKGDLGQVVDYDEARKRATIKLVPRIDLQAIAKKYGGGISLKEAAVPAPRLISSHELEHFRSHIEIRRDRHSGEYFEILDGLMLKDGYLYKKVSIASIVYWGVQPSKEELLKFTEISKAEEEDVSWLSTVYNVRKKMKSSQTSDLKGASEEGNGFNLHDLVLFGRKAFGVIIDMGKDGIKILKGDREGQEAMTIKTEDIKSHVVDKMFTASDRHRKTIYINDVVKVLEGLLEGRQGTVRHMYKGTLFIYDENQEENSGIFCAKSDLCENITPPKDSSFRKAGNKSSSSFNQPPLGSCEQEDSSCTFSRNRRSENQTFSIGQTLRIRKGPLKGYLCRVVGIYRSDVTVKLDSLVKVITVEEQFLSIPNLKRDIAAEMPPDIFGNQERSIGGLSGNGGEQTIGTSSWDGGSTSWQALSSSGFSFATNNDQKTEQEQGADPWGSKVSLAGKDQEQGADPWGSKASLVSGDQGGADPWGTKLAPGARVQVQGADPWGSKVSLAAKDQEQGADPWGTKASLVAGDQGGADPWDSKLAPGARENEQGADPWVSNVAGASADKKQRADPWGSKAALGDSSHSDKASDNWVKASSTSVENSAWNKAAGRGSEKDGDGWNKASIKVIPPTASIMSSSDREQVDDPWASKVSVAAKDHKQGTDLWGSKASFVAEDQGGADPWASKLSAEAKEQDQGADPWGSNVAVASTDKEQKADPWGSKVALGDSSCSGKALDSWSKASNASEGQNSSWNKAVGGDWKKDGDTWNNPASKSTPVTPVTERGGVPSGGNMASGWETAAMGTKSAVEHGGVPSSWDKAKVSSGGQSGWDTADWGKAGSSTKNGSDGWNNPKSFGGDQVSNWKNVENEHADKSNQRNSWDKTGDFKGGHGFGGGRGGNSWDKPVNRDGGQGSSWGRASDWNDGAGGSRDQDNGWNSKRDFDGGRGSSGGRGRGRFGGRGNSDENNQADIGGGWGSGRGRGRGRYGGRGNEDDDNQDRSDDFGGGWGSGRGRGRGRYGGRENEDDDNQDRSDDFGGGWGSGRGRGRGRYGGRGNENEDNQGDFGGGWGSGRGRGRGRYGGKGNGDDDDFGGGRGSGRGRGRGWYGGRGGNGNDDNQDRPGDFGGGWGSGRGRGRGRYGGRERGSGNEDVQERPGDFGGWGSGKGGGQREHEQSADAWGSNVVAESADKEQRADPWGGKAALGDSSHSDKAFDSWGKASSTSGEQNFAWNKASGGKYGDGWNKPSVVITPTASGISSSGQEQGADPWASKVSAGDQRGADPWGNKLAAGAKEQEQGADPWGSKLAAGAKEQKQGADPWGSNVSAASRDKEQKADPWGGSKAALGDSSHSDPWGSKVVSRDKEQRDDPWGSKWASGDSGKSDMWGKGSDWNGAGSSRGGDNGWNRRQTDFDGGEGSSRGRGRGRSGGGREGNEEDQNRSGGFGGGWDSGRGWNGDSGNSSDNFGHGRGRSHGRGRFQSSEWN